MFAGPMVVHDDVEQVEEDEDFTRHGDIRTARANWRGNTPEVIRLVKRFWATTDNQGPILAERPGIGDGFVRLGRVHLHGRYQQHLDRFAVHACSAGADVRVPELKDGPGAGEAGPGQCAGHGSRPGGEDFSIVKNERQHPGRAVEGAENDRRDFGQVGRPFVKTRFQPSIGPGRDESVCPFATGKFHRPASLREPQDRISPRPRRHKADCSSCCGGCSNDVWCLMLAPTAQRGKCLTGNCQNPLLHRMAPGEPRLTAGRSARILGHRTAPFVRDRPVFCLSDPFRSLPRCAVPSPAAAMNLPQPMTRLCFAENTNSRETPAGVSFAEMHSFVPFARRPLRTLRTNH